uniref:Uncharacterized protein n=1 Tax=Rhizophora mucronata TaxID=61149 RepID=A0A2P2IH85_RHIMU
MEFESSLNIGAQYGLLQLQLTDYAFDCENRSCSQNHSYGVIKGHFMEHFKSFWHETHRIHVLSLQNRLFHAIMLVKLDT